ncbi:MAG: hypothetical protein ACPHCJ_09020, partial [Oceanococcaceae bacterium]
MATTTRKAGGRREIVLLLLAALALGGTLGLNAYIERASFQDREWLALARQLQTQITELGNIGDSAARGLTPDFRSLEGAQANVQDGLLLLTEGDELIDLPPPPAVVSEPMLRLDEAWLPLNDNVDQILDARGAFNAAERASFELRRVAGTAQEQAVEEQGALRQSQENTSRLLAYSRIQVALEVLRAEALRIIGAGRDADITIEGMNSTLRSLMDDLARTGSPSDSALRSSVGEVESLLRGLTRQASKLAEIQSAAASLSQLGTAVTGAAIEVEDALTSYAGARPAKQEYVYYLGVATIVLLALFV